MTHSGSGAKASKKSDAGGSGQGVESGDVKSGGGQSGLFDLFGVTISAEQRAQSAHVPQPVVAATPAKSAGRSPPKSKPVDDKAGHRGRLLTRFREGGAEAMPDYEMLEMILFRAIPRGDTKPLAKALMAKFKNFSAVINAADERLMEIEGIGQRAVDEIKMVRAAALRMMQSAMMHRDVLNTWSAVLDYCKAAQGYDDIERFRILFLDKRNQLIADEVQQSGTVDHTPVYVREIIKRALQLGATALVLVHNHPSGDPSPSRADIDMTKLIVDAARPLAITIHDHVIVGRTGHFSMKAAKLM